MRGMVLLLLACRGSEIVAPSPPADTATDTAGDTAGVETIPGVDACEPGAVEALATEGHAVSVRVGCMGQGTARAFDVPALPEGASFDAATSTFTWTPGLADAGEHTFEVVSRGEVLETGTFTVQVADAWDDPQNVPVDPAAYAEEYGLPVFHLTRPDTTNSETDTVTSVVYRGHTYTIDLQYHGASSLYYPKKSYGMAFAADDEFEDAEEGFASRHDIVLVSTFDDNGYVRQALCYDLWRALDEERHHIQTMFAVLYVNGVYEGLYLVVDKVDGDYWDDHGYAEAGNLYKAVTHEANYYASYGGVAKSSWHAGYEKKEGVPGEWEDLDEFVRFAVQSDDATFAAELGDRFDMEELIDWWILVRWTEADDSGGKNAYVYVDPTTGLMHHAPWDFNHSFGQSWQTERVPATTDYDFYWSNNLFARALEHPDLAPAWEERMRAALDGPLAARAVEARMDAWLDRVGLSAARDWSKWASSYQAYGGWSWRTDWTTHDEEVAYLRAWIAERADVVEGWYPP